jgi:hypothetical protein
MYMDIKKLLMSPTGVLYSFDVAIDNMEREIDNYIAAIRALEYTIKLYERAKVVGCKQAREEFEAKTKEVI